MSGLLNDVQFKADMLAGYEALAELLKEFDEGAWIHKPSPSGGFRDASQEDMDRMLDRLALLKHSIHALIVGRDTAK